MADLPATTDQSSKYPKLSQFDLAVAELIFAGWPIKKIAKQLEPEDKLKRRRMREYLRRLTRNSYQFQQLIAEMAHGEMVAGLGPATSALMRRAKKGRPDAIKLAFEASGFHNPRVQHEHSGDIKITLESIPRPTFQGDDEDVVDADVVDEE